MYFSRIQIDPRTIRSKDLINFYHKGIYGEHQLLWKFFEKYKDTKRYFLYRQEHDNRKFKYYVLSENIPSNFMEPNIHIESKEYNPRLSIGQPLTFSIRVNPTVTLGNKRHDIIMHKKRQYTHQENKPPLQQIIQDSGTKWFEKQAGKNGFSFKPEMIVVNSYQQHKSNRKHKKISYSTVDISGNITVEDVSLFRNALFRGIGKSKAFGCGLMLIKKT